MKSRTIPAVLTIAGSDSGGGAGIQADLRTFHALQVYGCSAITAVTSQNPNEVRRVDVLPAEAVKSQLATILDTIPIRFAKTGMLANRKVIECTAEIAATRNLSLIVDPVMVSTSGTQLLQTSAISAMKTLLLPLAEWLTPNIPEAELLCGRKVDSLQDLADLAVMLHEQYHCNILLKSGHLPHTDDAPDIVCYGGKLYTLTSPKVAIAKNTAHGTGCTLSAALTANLATGKNWQEAVMESKAFVLGSLAENVALSNHLHQMYPPERSYLHQISLQPI